MQTRLVEVGEGRSGKSRAWNRSGRVSYRSVWLLHFGAAPAPASELVIHCLSGMASSSHRTQHAFQVCGSESGVGHDGPRPRMHVLRVVRRTPLDVDE
jgi:hypothetical protein